MKGSTIVLIGAAGAALLFMSGRKGGGEGGTGGSLDIPALFGTGNIGGDPVTSQPALVSQLSLVSQPQASNVYYLPSGQNSGYTKKEVSSGQYSSPITGNMASQLYQYSDAGISASAIEKKTGAYPLSPLNSPSRDSMAADYFARVANYEKNLVVKTKAGSNLAPTYGQGFLDSSPATTTTKKSSNTVSSSKNASSSNTVQSNPGSNSAPSYGKGWM